MRRYGIAILVLLAHVLPIYSYAQHIPTPWEQSTVYRDEWGVPHIYGDNAYAMAFGMGYIQAEDHLDTMLLAYRIANGRAAEVLGEGYAESDEVALRMRHSDLAYDAYSSADGMTRALCSGFADGVNSWMLDRSDDVPGWAEAMRPSDVLALMHYFLMSQAPFDLAGAYYPAPGMPSANVWAVGSSHSASGAPILVMNPHADYLSPIQWYEAHLSTPDFEMYGATLYGLPIPLMGHNPFIAWGLSPNHPDNGDVYIETNFEDNRFAKSVMHESRGSMRPVLASEARPYYVRDGNGLSERAVWVERTARGPILAYSSVPYSASLGGYGRFGAIRQFYEMGKSANLSEFRRALGAQELPTFHVVYADRGGNLFYQYGVNVGEKRDAYFGGDDFLNRSFADQQVTPWDFPLPNSDPKYAWGKGITYGDIPFLLNPKSDFVQASGCPPWLVTSGIADTRSDWADWLVRDEDSYRAKRLRRLLADGPRNLSDHQSILFDRVVPVATTAVPYLLNTADTTPSSRTQYHPDLPAFLDTLRDWDFLATRDSYAMTCFHVWWSLFRRDRNGDVLPSESIHALIQESPEWFKYHALNSASEAAMLMRNTYQTVSVPWGEVHALTRGDKYVPMDGSESSDTLFFAGDDLYDGYGWPVTKGHGFAMAVELGDVPEARSVLPFGVSDRRHSPHFDDQLELGSERRMKRAHFQRGDVERNAQEAIGTSATFRTHENDVRVRMQSQTPRRFKLRSATEGLDLPKDTVVFSRFVEPEMVGASGWAFIEMEFAIGPDVCAEDDLGALSVHRYDMRGGWLPVPAQWWAEEEPVLRAEATRPGVFAVLGPASLRRELVAEAKPLGIDRPPAPPEFRDEEITPWQEARAEAPNLPLPLETETDYAERVKDLLNEDVERVSASARPEEYQGEIGTGDPGFIIPEPPADGQDWVRKHPGGAIIPTLPPGWTPEAIRQAHRIRVNVGTSSRHGGEFKPPEVVDVHADDYVPFEERERIEAEKKKEEEQEKKKQREALPTPSPREVPSWQESRNVEEVETAPEPTSPTWEGVAETPKDARTEEVREIASVLKSQDKKVVLFTDVTPAELSKPKTQVFRESMTFVEDTRLGSPMASGRKLEMRPPARGLLFHLNMQTHVMAQAVLVEVPPDPYPDGLAPYTPITTLLTSPSQASGNVVLSLTVERDMVAPENFDSLQVYTHDAMNGWRPLDRQTLKPDTFIISGMDFDIRTYVVLGPAEHRNRAPAY